MDEQLLVFGIGIASILVALALGESIQWCVKNNTSIMDILHLN
jgi:hypothetical protein